MMNQEVDPQFLQMVESQAAKSTLCPLMKRTGNCLCKAQCPYDHTPAFKKNLEEIKQFVPSKGGKFSLAAAQHSENLNTGAHSEGFTQSNNDAQNQQNYAGFQGYEGEQYQGYPQNFGYYGGPPPTFTPQDVYEDEEGDLDDQGEEWFPAYSNCECCKGYVNNCKGEACSQLGQCYCIIQKGAERAGLGSP